MYQGRRTITPAEGWCVSKEHTNSGKNEQSNRIIEKSGNFHVLLEPITLLMKRMASIFLAMLLFTGACSAPVAPEKIRAGNEPKSSADTGNTTPVSVFRLDDRLFPPPDTIAISAVLGISESQLLFIPQGYEAASATMNYVFGAGTPQMEVDGFIGQTPFTFSGSGGLVGWKAFGSLQDQQSRIPVSIQGPAGDSISGEAGFRLSVEVLCVPVR